MSEPAQNSENIILTIGASMMGIMLVYGVATDLLGFARASSRTLSIIALSGWSAILVARFARLHRKGIRILVGQLPPTPTQEGDTARDLLWVLGSASLSAYSAVEILRGGFVLGALGSLAGVATVFVVARHLTRGIRI